MAAFAMQPLMVVWLRWWCSSDGGVAQMVVWLRWWCGSDGGVAQMVVWLRWWCGSDGGVAAFYKESPAKHANERLVSVVVLELFGSFFDCGFEVLWSQ